MTQTGYSTKHLQIDQSIFASYGTHQRAKKVMSDSPGLVDFAFGPVNSVLNLPDGQVNFFGKFKLQKDGHQSC